jgi:Mn2+/Fe2+ NRAMP family transporter
MYLSQVVNGLLLPVVLVFMLILINDERIMGRHTNSPIFNLIAIALSVAMAGMALTSGMMVILKR